MSEEKKKTTVGYLNKMRYIAQYKKTHCKTYSLQFNKTTDAKYIDLMEKHKGRHMAYLKEAIDFYEANH